MAVTATASTYGETAASKRTRCRSVSKAIGERRPISAYLPATGIDRRDDMNFAMGLRKNPSGPSGIMSGSRNKLSRNGSTAGSESGPPNWNNTIPTRFFPAKLFPSRQRRFQPFDILAQSGGPLRHGHEINEKYAPADHVRREHAAQVLHPASASRARTCASPRAASSS